MTGYELRAVWTCARCKARCTVEARYMRGSYAHPDTLEVASPPGWGELTRPMEGPEGVRHVKTTYCDACVDLLVTGPGPVVSVGPYR